MQFNLADLFEAVADAVPEREALVAGESRASYAQLDERATRFANWLRGRGVGPGDHVGVYAYNRTEWLEAMLGCFKARAVPINVNYRYVSDELRYLFENADLVALVFERAFAPRVSAVAPGLSALRHLLVLEDGSDADAPGAALYEDALRSTSARRAFESRSPDDLYVVYTGGTTGKPKGVMWRQEDVYYALGGGIDPMTGERVGSPEEVVEKARANVSPVTMLPLSPLMHLGGQWGTMSRLLQGNRTVLYTGHTLVPEDVWGLVERERVNVLFVAGDAMARPLVEALEQSTGAYDLSSLFSVASGAAIFSPTVKAQLLRLLPNVVVTDSIGSSEGGFGGMQFVQPDVAGEGVRVSPGPGTAVLEEGTWRRLDPGSGVVGKLARSGNVPLGYYKDPVKTAQTFVEVDGTRWAIPGDFARVEEDGSVVLLGRDSSCINTGGEKVYSEEVESAIKAHPDVYDAVVVGVPDERWGQRVAAVVQPRAGRTIGLEDLQAHCREHLAGYKLPRELHVVDEVVRHPTGKPDYPWAREVALSGRSRVEAGASAG